MKKLEYQVSFTTPAFLGNAEQAGQWRTPPFKALIRQWWRVVHAPKVRYDVSRLRHDEDALFGTAADGDDSRQSLVRLRMSAWESGNLDRWERDDRLPHSEVTNHQGEVMQIGAQLYLGYGPLTFGDTGRRNQQGRPIRDTVLNQDPKRSAIADSTSQTLTIMVPDEYREAIITSVRLAAWFGTLGSRSRNGWGALQIVAKDDKTPSIPELTTTGLAGVLRPLNQCLELDWPHAVGGVNNRPLVWTTHEKNSWRETMKELARVKIAFRVEGLPFTRSGEDPDRSQQKLSIDMRHLLAYPVTHHGVAGVIDREKNNIGWLELDRNGRSPKVDGRRYVIQSARLANQIRFKVAKRGNNWYGVIVHLPCTLPRGLFNLLSPNDQQFVRSSEMATWQTVHRVLDREAARIQQP